MGIVGATKPPIAIAMFTSRSADLTQSVRASLHSGVEPAGSPVRA